MGSALELAGAGEFAAVADVDQKGIVIRDELAGLIDADFRHPSPTWTDSQLATLTVTTATVISDAR